jgi:acetyl-CoA carboxylase biotin carboxylase subunit
MTASRTPASRTINKVLVANRGEIALRIFRTLRDMGIKSVAVYSDADAAMPFARYADEAVRIGPAPAAESYLIPEKILEAALATGADAIHPGYGFLSENADFAETVEAAGLAFIGPTPDSIRTMGDKLAAKEAVLAQNVPLVPGTEGAIDDPSKAIEAAEKIGFPIMVKASAGGGGKGMRVVEDPAKLEEEIKRAMSEAQSAFGDGSVFLERFVSSPRHIEFQVLADGHGNVVHLFERECSIQRRHQKVVEEAPSALLDQDLRDRMGACAIDVARSCSYVGAGTVEFLVDADRNFFFLEMNTRLQVEHPVTEMITGIDLVEEQIRVARGEKLRFAQDDLRIHGHAIELRVYAEDARAGFLPATGRIAHYAAPEGPGIRVDSGVGGGDEIGIYYDPMVAKLCAHGMDREQAIARMIRAIDEFSVSGLVTTLDFGRFAIDHTAFRSGQFDTGFVAKYFTPASLDRPWSEAQAQAAAAVVAQLGASTAAPTSAKQNANETIPETRPGWTRRFSQ